jgi:hypothetical protein
VHQFCTIANTLRAFICPPPLTRMMPISTGTAPIRKLASIGSCKSHAPSTMPNSGVMNEKTPRREAKYLRSNQNHSKKLANDTTTE